MSTLSNLLSNGNIVQGPAGTITVGTVTTTASGTPVAITNSGTSTNAILNFAIPGPDVTPGKIIALAMIFG